MHYVTRYTDKKAVTPLPLIKKHIQETNHHLQFHASFDLIMQQHKRSIFNRTYSKPFIKINND